MADENTSKPLRELAAEIAKALGADWIRGTKFDADDVGEREWRARLENPKTGEALFLSTTWGKKGMLYVGGWFPDAIDRQSVSLPQAVSINIALTKTPEQMARDIARRLLPEYSKQLGDVLRAHVADLERKEAIRKTKYRVAEILSGLAKDNSEIISGHGSVDIQVCGPDSLRFHGHCLYFTPDQLEKIRNAVPELFERQS